MAKENFDKNIKQAKIYADSLDAINKKLDTQEKRYGWIAKEMGIAYGGFAKQIEKSNAQRREENKLLEDANQSLKEQRKLAGDSAAEMLGIKDILKDSADQSKLFSQLTSKLELGPIENMKDVQSRLNELQKEHGELSKEEKTEFETLSKLQTDFFKEEKEANKNIEEALNFELNTNKLLRDVLERKGVNLENNANLAGDINSALRDEKGIHDTIATSIEATTEQKMKSAGISDGITDSMREQNRIAKVASNEMRNQEGFLEKIQGLYENNADTIKKGIFDKMKEYDQVISDAGKNFGYIQDMSMGTASQMANLNMEAARFGMSTKEVSEMMGALGDELKTIDQKYLADSVEHFVAIQKATGISAEEVSKISGEMMRSGKSAEDVEKYMEGANKTAKMMGVNTKKVLQGVAKNLDKMRQMGFQGGEESLTKMVATAERLRMNVDEIFDMGSKARNIEGAMDMAAELQLAGGSFANVDPMSLLSAARKGPEELQNILKTMGDDIGAFNDKGEFAFDAVDVDRLKIMADATGVSLDSMQKMIQKNAETNKKTDMLGLSEAIGEDERNFLADLTSIDKDGNISMDDDLAKYAEGAGISLDGVEDLDDLNQDQIQALMAAKEEDIASLEEQAEQNLSFQESMAALKDALLNAFTIFEPFIKWLSGLVQWLNGSAAGKWVVAIGALAFIAIPKLVGAFGKFKEGASAISNSFKGMKGGKGVLGKIKGAFTGGKGGGGQDEMAEKISGTADKGGKVDAAKGSGGGLKSLAEGLKAMGDKKVFIGIGATALAGPALLLMLPGIPTILAMGLVGAMGKVVTFGFQSLARGISAMGNAKGIWKGLAVMALVGIALIPFAFAASLMADVNWLGVLAGVGILALVILGLMGLGAMLMGPQIIALLIGIGVLIMVGAGLLVFGIAMQQFAQGAALMQGLDFTFLSDLGAALWYATPGLILGGFGLMMAAPALMLGSMGLLALGIAAQTLSGVDWNAFALIGDALLGLVPGLLGFSLAGLMFLNPITLLGMLLMIGNLGMLAMVMVPLAESLAIGADGLDRFADGLEKLQQAANSLDLEKLDALRSLSWSMAIAGLGGGMLGAQIDQIAEALNKLANVGSGGGKGGGTQKIQVDLKLNGRDLQSIIIDDTEIVS